MGLYAFYDAASQRYQPSLARLIPAAASEAVGSPTPLHHSLKNLSRSKAVSRFNR
jgi:hypothetical protein